MSGSYAGPPRTKLPFPINILLNQKFFYTFFIVLMSASMGAGGLVSSAGGNAPGAPDVPDVTPAPTVVNAFSWPEGAAQVIDATKPYVATIKTNKGDIKIELASDAPKAVNSFAFLVGKGFYNDTAFFYVNKDYFAQAGDRNCSPASAAVG